MVNSAHSRVSGLGRGSAWRLRDLMQSLEVEIFRRFKLGFGAGSVGQGRSGVAGQRVRQRDGSRTNCKSEDEARIQARM